MKKLLALTLSLLALYGCSPSPAVLNINGKKLDISEFAFYLNYQLMSVEKPEELTKDEVDQLKSEALKQMVSNEIVLQKCKEYGLKLSKEEKTQLKEFKKEFIKSLGGSAKYLDFLKQSAMTDRVYDKNQTNAYYHNMLMAYLTENPADPNSIGFTDEGLRKYFSENYIKIKYIYMSLLDENGAYLADPILAEEEDFIRVVAQGAKVPEKDFDSLIEKYNDAEEMRLEPDGLVMTLNEAEEHPIYNNIVPLKTNEVGGPFEDDKGYYILKRYAVDPSYFDAHHERILNNAIDERFTTVLEQWEKAGKVKISDLYAKIDLTNYMSYVK